MVNHLTTGQTVQKTWQMWWRKVCDLTHAAWVNSRKGTLTILVGNEQNLSGEEHFSLWICLLLDLLCRPIRLTTTTTKVLFFYLTHVFFVNQCYILPLAFSFVMGAYPWSGLVIFLPSCFGCIPSFFIARFLLFFLLLCFLYYVYCFFFLWGELPCLLLSFLPLPDVLKNVKRQTDLLF